MRKKKPSNLLTPVELEMMMILWRIGQGNVHEVLSLIPSERGLKYTTVSTMLRILEQKKIVQSKKEGRGHTYFPILSKEAYEKESLDNLFTNVFDGEPLRLVSRLVELKVLQEGEIEQIRKLLEERGTP